MRWLALLSRLSIMRRIIALSWPILVTQIVSRISIISDAIFVGHYATQHLAAVAVSSAIQMTIALPLGSVLQAFGPIISYQFGAKKEYEIGATCRQGVWLTSILGLIGAIILCFPDPWLIVSKPPPKVAELVRDYLFVSAFALPANLLCRSFYSFSMALGNSRIVMMIATSAALLNVPLSYALVFGKLGIAPLGALGCAVASLIISWLALSCAAIVVAFSPLYRPYCMFGSWEWPRLHAFVELLRIGLPMGFSTLMEISSLTFIAILIAPLGAEVQGGHSIVTNIVSLCFACTLSIGLATSVLIGQALGGLNAQSAWKVAQTGLVLAMSLAILLGVVIITYSRPIMAMYSKDPQVQAIALSLIGYAVTSHFFNAIQTLSCFALRGYRATLVPMIVHVSSFWGIGLAWGWWLAFHALPARGVTGFWFASVTSLGVAAMTISIYLVFVANVRVKEYTGIYDLAKRAA